MKKSTTRPVLPASLFRSLAATALLAALGATTAIADTVYVTAMRQTTTTTAVQNDGSYVETGITLGNTSTKGSAPGRPVNYPNTSRAYLSSTPLTSTSAGVDIKPTLGASSTDGSVVYQIDYNFNSLGNVNTNSIFTLTCSGGTLSTNETPLFRSVYGVSSKWQFMGYLTNSSTTPTISFRYASGFISAAGTGNRVLFDCWRFTRVSSCSSVATVEPDGPLATNLSTVKVTGVANNATQVNVYQIVGNTTNLIGSTTVSSPPSTVPVPVSGMSKGNQVIATQVVNGQEGCLPAAGVPAGGGASPRIRVAASISQDASLSGPIGASAGGNTANLYWLHATGSSVAGGLVLQPSTNWQTVVFYPRDSKYAWNGTPTLPDPNPYGGLEGLAFALDDSSDTGPYEIYVDNLRNGNVLIQDCESSTLGAEAFLRHPGFSGSTSGNILSNPDVGAVTNSYAATGTQSQRLNWQFKDLSSTRWVRINSGVGTGAGQTPSPQVDLTQPIAVDVLILPVNQTNAHSMGSMGLLSDVSTCYGSSASFTEVMTPPTGATPSYTYVWKKNGTVISGATQSTLTLNNLHSADAGTYSVTVSDGAASGTVSATLTLQSTINLDVPPYDAGLLPVGGSGGFNVVASNPSACSCGNPAPFAYQWYHNGTLLPGATDASYNNGNLAIADAGAYNVVVSNTCSGETLTSGSAKLYVYDPNLYPGVSGCGNGVLGLYWTNHLPTAPFTGEPTYTNYDYTLENVWGTEPFSAMYPYATDHFTVRWVGTIQAPYDGQHYKFYTTTDDGVRLWVNGQLLIDKWVNQSGTTWSNTIVLSTNSPTDLVMEYYENTGSALAVLSWESESVYSNPVPPSAFCAADPGTGIPPLTTLSGPTNNATLILPGAVTLSASVTQETAPVNKVEFYSNGTNLLGSVAAPGPYTLSWTPSAAGVYNLSARTYYNTSHFLTTPANKLTVSAPALGGVTITSISGTTLSYTGGSGSQFVLLSSASPTAPLNSWTRVATNAATPGSFTIPAVGSAAQTFYRIKSE